MQLGIMASTFKRPTLEATLDAVAACGVRSVQFDLACAGAPTMPAQIDPALCVRIREAFAARNLTMAALSGTFNMIHPDPAERADGLRRLRVLLAACAALGATIVTLCTGTRDPHNMWRRHPDNDTPAAWADLVESMREAVRGAEGAGVTLAFEPEVANVVDSAPKARRLLDEIGSPRLRVVFDGANIFHSGELPRMRQLLEEAVTLLGPDIALAHAKDLDHDGEAGHLPAGRGVLDYSLYLALLKRSGFTGALILHGLAEEDVPSCLAFVRAIMSADHTSTTTGSDNSARTIGMDMDIVRLHERALDEAARLVDGVRPDQMGLPTPCSEWDVRALLTHLVGGNMRWTALARGEPIQRGRAQGAGPGADLLGGDPADAYRRSAAELKAAWQDPAALERSYELPIGVLPGRAAVNLRLVETVAHAWDLARSTGQQPAFDPEIVRAALRFTQANLPGERPPGGPFAPPVPVADDLPEMDRLAALLGRTP